MRLAPALLLLSSLVATSAAAQVISSDVTWSGNVALDRDVRINPGVTVTVSPGATITASTTDAANLGTSTSLVEIIVQGTLTVNGSAAQGVTFTSSGSTAGAWYGVRVEPGGTLNVTSATLEEASNAIHNSGTVTVAASTFRLNTYGLAAPAGTANVGTSLFTGHSYGGYGQGGALTLDHCTLVSNTYAVYSAASVGTLAVHNSILTNNTYGLYRTSGAASITNTFNDVWQNTTENYYLSSAGSGSISSNPLYVGGTNYRLTSNSPARKSDNAAGDMGAFPYVADVTPGLYGTLWTNTTLSANATVGGDLVVPVGVTLTLNAGAVLTFGASDVMGSGTDASRGELIVRGTLSVNGATLTASGTTPGSWIGVRVESGATATVANLTVERASFAFDVAGTVAVNGSTLRNNSYGVRTTAGTANVGTTLFTGHSYGGYGQGGALTLDHCTLVSNTYAVYSAASVGTLAVHNSIVTGNTYGLYRTSGAASITNTFNDVWQNTTDNYYLSSAGSGSISSNPLYVGGTNYRLTSNSPARRSDNTGTDMGAFPYVSDATSGLTGTLWANQVLSSGAISGDLVVPVGVTLTVPAGVVLTAATSDAMSAGNDPSRVELVVRGTLNITGTPTMPATLTSTGTTAGSWIGLRVETGGTVNASGVVIERASYALDNAGTASLTNAALRNNSYGVRTTAGSASVATTLLSGNSYGAYGQGGGVTLDHCTLVSNTYAVYSAASVGSLAVHNSILTNNTYGLYRTSGAASITNTFNDVWQNTTDNYYLSSAGSGSISSNPLYVGGTNYRLTSNSPARKSDSTGTDMGAFPYVADVTPGLYGTLWSNTTLSASATLGGDLTVPAGVTVTVAPGVTLTAPVTDVMGSGNDASRAELIVRGTLLLQGGPSSPVTLTSTGTTAGAWIGVRVESGGTATATNAVVERASYAFDVAGNLTVNGATLRNNSYGVRTTAGTANVGTTLLSGNSYGGYGQGGGLTLDHCTLVSNTYAAYSAASVGTLAVHNSILTGNTYGLYRTSGAASITNTFNDVWQNTTDNYYLSSAGSGSISSNPLYVGGTNYRLTSNSPARLSDNTGNDMGAFPYGSDPTAGFVGTLWTNTTLSTNTTMPGDVTVGPGVTLTISPGVTLTAATSDQMGAGSDPSRAELVVRGTLTTSASAANPVVLTSTGSSAGSWTGVRVESGGAAALTGVTITRASYGLDAASNATLTDSIVTANSYGLRVTAGNTTATRVLFSGNSYGGYGQGGALTLDHCTLVSNTYAVYSAASVGTLAVHNSILTGNTYGLYRTSGAASITNTFNDVWQNTTDNYYLSSAGSGSFSSNPLYVGGTNYRLTSNSPARKSDNAGGDLGAFAYVSDVTPGLSGTLWTNTTLSASAALGGDLTVAPGVTLTLGQGVTLTAPVSDLMGSGTDSTRTELIVLGTLQASGTPASPVVLTSTGTAASSWVGVRVPTGGTASLTSTTIQRASSGVEVSGGTATVTGSRITTSTYGARVTAGSATVNFTIIDGNSYGAYGQGGALWLDHDTFYGNSYAVYSAASTGSVTVTNSILTTNLTAGLHRTSGAVSITNSSNLHFNSPAYLSTYGSNTLTVDPQLQAPASGDFRLSAGSPARGAGTSSSDLGAIPFAPGAVSRVVISPTSATVAAGGTVTFSATAFDAQNNPVPSATFTWSALSSAGTITSGGVLSASCTTGSVTNGVTVSSNGQSASANVTITTAPIASLVVTPASATVRSQQTRQFAVTALDACNNMVPSPAVTWTATGSVGVIDANGLYTAGCSRGAFANAIVATAGSVTGRASVTVDPGLLSSVTLSPSSATLAINGTRQFTGTAADGCGNAVTATVSYATTVPGGTINGSGLFSAGTTPGTYTGGVTGAATEGVLTRTGSSTVTVTGGAVASVVLMPATATLTAGGTTNFMAVALDSAGNMVAGAAAWSVMNGGGSITQAGVFTAGATAGTFTNTVQATIGGVSGYASVIVQPGAVTRVVVAPAMVTLAPMGTTTFTAQAFDANNNAVTAPVTWSASTSAGTITQGGVFTAGTMSGNYPAAVTATVGGVTASASVSINSGALAQLTVTPSVATTQAGGTVAFSATGRDGNGNTVAVTPTWSVVAGGGTISSMGVFTAGNTTGTYTNTVRAESNGVTAFATVSVSPGPLVRLELSPASATLLSGATQQFSAAGKDAFGNTVAAAVTWTANPNAGSITAAGLFTAGTLAGDFSDGVTASAGLVTAQASVSVQVPVVSDAGVDAGVDAGIDAGVEVDAGVPLVDAGVIGSPDAGVEPTPMPSGCGCAQVDALAPLLGLVLLALRRRRGGAPLLAGG